MDAFMYLVFLCTLALPLLIFWYATKQYLTIRTMRGGWWKDLAWLPIAPVGYHLVYFVIPRVTATKGAVGVIISTLVAAVADFWLLLAALFLYLLSIAYGASRRDQNIPPEDRHMHRAAEIRKAVAWEVGVAALVLALIVVLALNFPVMRPGWLAPGNSRGAFDFLR